MALVKRIHIDLYTDILKEKGFLTPVISRDNAFTSGHLFSFYGRKTQGDDTSEGP